MRFRRLLQYAIGLAWIVLLLVGCGALYRGQELPDVLVELMTDTPWCEETQEYVPMDDPARIHRTPKTGT